MRIKKRTNDRGHITSGRRGTGVFWQQWDLSLCFPREPQLGSVTVPAQERSSLKEELSSFPCEQTCTSPAVMAPEVLGVRTSMHPAADCQEGDSFSISQMPRAGLSGTRPPPAKQTPGAQHHGSLGAKSVCCHPSQFNNKPSAGEIFFGDFIQAERLSNPIIDQPGCSPCIFFPYRYVPYSENTSKKWGRLALCWSTKSWHELSVFPGEKLHESGVHTRGCCILCSHSTPLACTGISVQLVLHQWHEH